MSSRPTPDNSGQTSGELIDLRNEANNYEYDIAQVHDIDNDVGLGLTQKVGPSQPTPCSQANNHDNVRPQEQPVLVSLPAQINQIGGPQAVSSAQGTSLGFAVPASTKQKIWDGEYVDFALLLNDNSIQLLASTQQQQSELVFAVEGGNMVIRPAAPQKKKIDSLDKWQSAFHVFMAIFLAKHVDRAAELLKYAETIRLAAVQFSGFGWRAYDEQFRLRRAADPTSSWGQMDVELWVTVAAAAQMGPSPRQTIAGYNTAYSGSKNSYGFINSGGNGRVNSPGNRFAAGHCFAFNKSQGCNFPNCKFAHKCSSCSRFGHNALSCRLIGNHGNRQAQAEYAPLPAGNRPQARQFSNRRVPAAQPYGGGAAAARQQQQAQVTTAALRQQGSFSAAHAAGKPSSFRSSNAN